jgi:hypothetical protein
MKENKYYTPEISDIHLNYEMEWLQKANSDWSVLDGVDKDTWQKWDYKFQGFNINTIQQFIEDQRIRVKYLDKSDIEACGWSNVGDVECWMGKPPMYYWMADYKNAMMGYNPEDYTLVITYKDPCKSIDGVADEYNYPKTKNGQFRGICKSINELYKIMSWIGINTQKIMYTPQHITKHL